MDLEARGLTVTIGHAAVIRGIDLSLARGEVLGILGPSGAGKTTLFRAIIGELRPDGGSVHLNGVEVTSEPLWKRARRGIGYLPQTPSVLWDLTVEENLATFEAVAKRGRPLGAAARAAAVELEQRLHVKARDLSGGERRRLELARALVGDPKVLICDEPFAGIDPAGAERLGALLQQHADRGTAVMLADHHVEEALRICTRAALLVDGIVQAEGPPDTFRGHPLVVGRYLGSWSRTLPP